jgi:hypothetical protein
MAQVGTKREPRLPIGPPVDKIDKVDDDIILDPDVPEVETKLEDKDKDKDKFDEIKIAKIPLPPSKRIPDTDTKLFYDWMAILKPEHWVQLTWYMYRNWPRLNKPDDDVKYIDCGNYAITEQWILENHGSGDYMFICNEAGKPKNAKTICTAYVKNLTHPEYPPKVKMNELDVHFPSNKNYVDRMVAEGKLTVDLKPMNITQQQPNGGLSDQIILRLIDKIDKTQVNRMEDPKDGAIKAAFEIIGQGNKAATQMMLDQMKQDDPDKLVKLVQTIMGMVPKPPEHNGSESTTFMKMLVESQNKNAEIMAKKDETMMNMMMKLMEKSTTPPIEDNFDKSLERFTKLMELTGIGESLGGKKGTLEIALQYGAPILERALGIVQNLMALKAQGAAKIDPITGKEVPSNQPASPLPVSIASSSITAETPPQPTNGKADVRDAMVNNSQEQEEMIKQGLKQIGPKIVEALNRRTSGDTFAESIDNFLGPMVYNQLASLGESKMIEILQTDQQLWNQLKLVEPQLKIFIKEFIDYGKPEDSGDDDKIIDASEETTIEGVKEK